MDSVFHLEDADRAAFLEQMMQAFDNCVFICLRYYLPPPNNCLKGFDGIYRERRNVNQESLPARLFHVYRDSSAYPPTGLIPGIAFTTNNPNMKLELHEFQRLVSSDFQLQFYIEARIKTVVLIGCATGEIELGFSDHPQVIKVDVETEMKNLIQINFPHLTDPNHPHSSSSSSLRSLSVDSPEYPPLLFNAAAPPFLPQETLLEPTLPAPPPATSPREQALSRIRNAQFPSIETENAAMTNAILAVLSSSSSSSSLSTSSSIPTAFRRYRPNSAPPRSAAAAPTHSRFKRAVLFFRNLNQLSSRPEFPVQVNRPTDTQLHHMISERRRRERLNESFHILRSLLPPGTKKDKASVLSSTAEYMRSLKSQVAELKKRNLILESQLKSESGAAEASSGSSGERVSVEVVQVSSSSSSSSSGARFLDLRVRVRGESRLLDLVMRLTEFLKGQNNVSLTSVESNTRMLESVAVHVVIMRLRIEGDEFDESGFREAVRRNIGDE